MDIYYGRPEIDLAETGRSIRELRKANGYTVEDLGVIAGDISPQAVCKWQSGKGKPSLESLIAMSRAFNVAIEDIIKIKNESDKITEGGVKPASVSLGEAYETFAVGIDLIFVHVLFPVSFSSFSISCPLNMTFIIRSAMSGSWV